MNERTLKKIFMLILLLSIYSVLNFVFLRADIIYADSFTPIKADQLDLSSKKNYPETGSDAWEALSVDEKKAASDNFYGMDKNIKQFFMPKNKNDFKSDYGFEMYVWRKHPITGVMTRVQFTYGNLFAYPGETLYFFIKVNTDNYPAKNNPRIGWGFHNRMIHTNGESSKEAFKLDPYCTYMSPENVRLDGKRVTRWDDKSNVYGKTSTAAYPAPDKSIPYQGHVKIENAMHDGVYHYITFQYTLPQNLWYAAFSRGSGCDGQTGGGDRRNSTRFQNFSCKSY